MHAPALQNEHTERVGYKVTNQIDPREFRNALGQFATGVTVITTRDKEGRSVGVTASSFNSVSLSPPLVLWSLDKSAASLQAFADHGYFAVHVLAAGQEAISNSFARRGDDKFANIQCTEGVENVPLLPECAARFQCKLTYQYEGGDHVILVGEVLSFENFNRAPLIFHSGRYANARDAMADVTEKAQVLDASNGSFSSDFIGYLISRAHYQLHVPIVKDLARYEMDEIHYFILSVLCIRQELTCDELRAFISHTGHVPTMGHCSDMHKLGLLKILDATEGRVAVTDEGKYVFTKLLAADMARHEQALEGFSSEELTDFLGYLRRFIKNTDPGVPNFWE